MAILRICVSFDELRRRACTVPSRCQDRTCKGCKRAVHYDPLATVGNGDDELVLCTRCAESYVSHRGQ
jgi:predicted  nucleic acid-binding Zn-ribbon protein